MTRKEEALLRAKVRKAVTKDGLVKTAKSIGVNAGTLTRFLANAGTQHRGTLALIAQSMK